MLISPEGYCDSPHAESEDDSIRVIRVVVVGVTVVIHVTEVVRAISRPEPPVVRGATPVVDNLSVSFDFQLLSYKCRFLINEIGNFAQLIQRDTLRFTGVSICQRIRHFEKII